MRFHTKHILIALSLFVAAISHAVPSRPNPQRLVNDLAGIFSPAQITALENTLVAFDDSTSNQIAVVTVKDLEGYPASEYATRIGLEWQVGTAQFNNGIVVLVKPKTLDSSGQVFIAVGYGLEGAVPDAYVKRIIESKMIPYFRNNDYYAGVAAACDVLMKLASGEISVQREMEAEDDLGSVFAALFIIFLIMYIAIIISGKGGNGNSGGSGSNGPRTVYVGPIITSGRSYGGGGFSGGFGGGFGGFGGGSFGGGGAGGSW